MDPSEHTMTPSDLPSAGNVGPAETLEHVRQGALALVTLGTERLRSALFALEAGDFDMALTRISEAHGKIKPLADTQRTLGMLADGKWKIMRASGLTVGMMLLVGGGHALTIETIRCDVDSDVVVMPGQLMFTADAEVYIRDIEPV